MMLLLARSISLLVPLIVNLVVLLEVASAVTTIAAVTAPLVLLFLLP